ncbi:VQ motif-containing protein 8, chloroplastic [Momordica charantia]|uniref:VQ motif-containing protein 8, chloroplastic n=1 Tax=Momordica charantia TaxID=3673 RepID=A0A6J1DC48_MOMCH|nr:VQ motif-containing protein 8, chloroplastic [Momordica charantia]
MSPAKSCDINGPRPSPLLIHKHSRLIRKPPPQLRQPLIIYTHSPKIIHTQPKDFMALVQRLTGFTPPPPPHADDSDRNNNVNFDNDSSSVLTEEVNCGDHNHHPSYVKEVQSQSQSHSFLADVPLFTPAGLRYAPDATSFASPGLPNSLSPSFMEFLKGLPEF